MWTKSLLVPLIISIVITQCSSRSLWQAIKDIKNTIIFPNDVIDMRTNAPWPYCGHEGQEGNCRRKRDMGNGMNESNLTEVIDNESVEKENLDLLQDEEIDTDNLTITRNKTTKDMSTENDNHITQNMTSTENITQSINSILLTTENITNLIKNIIQTNNNCAIIIKNVTLSENETQVLDNFTITIENITNNTNNDNCTITIESTEISKTNTIQSIEEITNNPQDLATDEITTLITPEIRREIQNSEDYKETDISTSENILNVDQNSNTTVHINQQTNSTSENDSNFNYSILEINEDGGNLTSTVLANVNNTNNENQTIYLETSLIENNLISKQYKTINVTELEQNYNISIIYDENSSVVYPNNSTLDEGINEDMFDSQLNDNNTIINQKMSTLSDDITVLSISNEKENTIAITNFTNSFNVSDSETKSKISGVDLVSNFTTVLNENGFNLTESENEAVIFTKNRNESNINPTPDKLNDELAERGREKREIVMNLTSNLATTNETYKAEEKFINKTFSVDNAISIKTDTINKSTPLNDTVQSSAVKDINVAMTTEKVCLIQGEACTNSTQCCENFECTMFDIIKWSSNCDFKPSDPQMATPLSDIRIPKQIIPYQLSP